MPTGSCLCGDVTFTIEGTLAAPDACHCSQCRKQSGHYWASTDVPLDRLTMVGEDKLTWFESSPQVRRGFCTRCGSFLFWQPIGKPRMAVAMGALDAPTGAHLGSHIFTASKGDYYAIADDVPQEEHPPG